MERKVVLYIAMSLDGRVADAGGGVSWLAGQEADWPGDYGYGEFIKGVDTVLMGWNTYHQVAEQLSPGEWPYQGMDCYVFTHRRGTGAGGAVFTGEDPEVLVSRLKEQPGKDIWLCGGPGLAVQFARKGLLDRLHITVMPLVLGEGLRLFGEGWPEKPLRLERTETENGCVHLIYSNRAQQAP